MKEKAFIWPVSKDYAARSEQENQIKMEEAFKELEKYYYQISINEKYYREQVDALLSSGAKAGEILEILESDDGQVFCSYLYEFRLLEILCQIAEIEERRQEPWVFQNFDSIKSARAWVQQRIFDLRKFEFDWGEEYYQNLLKLISESKMSYICLAMIICKCEIIRKLETASKVTEHLYRSGKKREALLMLMWLEQMLPYSEEKIITFTATMLELGESRFAYEMLLKYQNPDENIKSLQEKLRRGL